MPLSACYPYRSEAAREACFAYFDTLAGETWPVSSEERLVPTSFGATFVRVSGPAGAPPLVLLPGGAATSLMFAPNVAALSRERRVFAVDRMGEFGKTLCAKPVPTIADMTEWMDEFLDGVHPDGPVDLLGMSYGGALAAAYALHRPAKVRRLVLLAPGATVLRPPLAFWARMTALAFGRRGFLFFFRWIFRDMAKSDPAWIARIVDETRLCFRSLERRKVPIPGVLSDAEWGRLEPPTLFLVGEHEVIYSAEKALARLRRVAPSVTAEIVRGAGHDLTFAQSAAVNRRILEFVVA